MEVSYFIRQEMKIEEQQCGIRLSPQLQVAQVYCPLPQLSLLLALLLLYSSWSFMKGPEIGSLLSFLLG